MADWFLEKVEVGEDQYVWKLHHLTGGIAKNVATIEDAEFALDALEIVKWREAAWTEHGMDLSFLQKPIDVWTGKPLVRDPDLPSYDIKFTKQRKRGTSS